MLAWKCSVCHAMPQWTTEFKGGVWVNSAKCCGRPYALIHNTEATHA